MEAARVGIIALAAIEATAYLASDLSKDPASRVYPWSRMSWASEIGPVPSADVDDPPEDTERLEP